MTDYATAFVNEFCNQLAKTTHGLRQMRSWYVFHDKRPGTIQERLDADAAEFRDYTNLFHC